MQSGSALLSPSAAQALRHYADHRATHQIVEGRPEAALELLDAAADVPVDASVPGVRSDFSPEPESHRPSAAGCP
jgi:hypothetical protein